MKSSLSFGPILPAANPLNFLDGINNLSDNLILSFEIEFALNSNKDALEMLFSNNSV